MKRWTTIKVAVAALVISALGYVPARSTEDPPAFPPAKSVEQMILDSETPADHEAIAAYYDKEAQDAHKKHAEHQKMEEWYQKNPAVNKSGFSFHCKQIASNYQKTAKEYEELAKLHREMAKSAK